MDTDAGGRLDHAGADLEQAGELGPGERQRSGHGVAQDEHQPVGHFMQHPAELVGEQALAGGPTGGELDLMPFDQIFRPSAGTIYGLVEMPGL